MDMQKKVSEREFSVPANYNTGDDTSYSEAPEFMCACGVPATVRKSASDRNPDREFICCGRKTRACYTWLWQDQLKSYGEDLVQYCHSATIDMLKEEVAACHLELVSLRKEKEELMDKVSVLSDLVAKEDDPPERQFGLAGRRRFNCKWMSSNASSFIVSGVYHS